jgi:hypothetical protein
LLIKASAVSKATSPTCSFRKWVTLKHFLEQNAAAFQAADAEAAEAAEAVEDTENEDPGF